MVRQCFLAGSSVPPGPCFQALSLSPLKCWSYLFGVSHRAYRSAVSETERPRAPICSPLVSKRLTCPSSRFMSLFQSICPRSAAISVLVRQLGKTTRIHFLQSFFPRRGRLLTRHPRQLVSQQKQAKMIILGDHNKRVPEMQDYAPPASRQLMRLVAALRLSWSEPPSRSNLPKDPPSKTATLHKKDDTDTRIIFKSCGTACSLQQFQRLTANFLLSVCLCSATNFDWYDRTETRFMRIPKCCAMWLKGAQVQRRTKTRALVKTDIY